MRETDCSVRRLQAVLSVEECLEKYVDVEKYLGFCRQCPNYGNCWSCPPYDFDPVDVWKSYDRLEILALQITPASEETRKQAAEDPRALLVPLRASLDEELARMEAEIPGSLRLNAGKCLVCPVCARGKGEPCRFPEKRRCSIESLGGAVGDIAAQVLRAPLQWAKNGEPPAYFVLVGGLLRKEPDRA